MGIRLGKAMTKLNIGKETVVEYLKSKPELEPTKELNPNSKLTDAQFEALAKEFAPDMLIREKANTFFKKKSKKEKEFIKPISKSPIAGSHENEVAVIEKIEAETHTDSLMPVAETQQEDRKESEVVTVLLNKLRYETNCITYKSGPTEFALWETGISRYVNSEKSSPNLNNVSTQILLNHSIHTFRFVDTSVLPYLLDLSTRLENEKFEKHLKTVEKKKEQKQKSEEKQKEQKKTAKEAMPFIHHRIQFSGLRFGVGFVTITYKKTRYFYRNYNIRNYILFY